MKIAILGSRGIPNAYGGFEQCAEYLSKGLVDKGHEVWVYNSHTHPYKHKEWEGVKIIHKYDPEYKIGGAGQFIYDLNCILDSRRRGFDVILQLGYTSSSIWGRLLPQRAKVVTNMDGLEWKRSKYSPLVQKFLKWAERQAILTSDCLISDSIGIQEYLFVHHRAVSQFIPYGAYPFYKPDEKSILKYGVKPYQYNMLIARLEPENNIETILEGVSQSNCSHPFLVIGYYESSYGQYLVSKFKSDERVKFIGRIYDIEVLNNLRYYSSHYFHGHSVGGTNPSLLEAMASHAFIIAHDNPFNKSVLGNDAFYFTNASDVQNSLEVLSKHHYIDKIKQNVEKIEAIYKWGKVIDQYEDYLTEGKK